MKKLIPIVLLLFVFLLPSVVVAQSDLSLAQVQVGLWPEFDRSAMLVIYHIQLPTTAQLPVDMALRIPAAAAAPNAVAVLAESGLVNVDYELESEGDWIWVKFQSESSGVQLEYYDPGLEISSTQRSFTYTWPGDYAVENMTVEMQQPAGAEGMQLEPDYDTAQAGSDGLTYYSRQVGALAAGEMYSQKLSYTKTDETLTAAVLGGEVGAAAAESTGTGFDWRWLLIPAALGLIGYGIFGIFGHRRKTKRRPKKAVKARRDAFCHSCGARARKGDRFCRQCGTELRG